MWMPVLDFDILSREQTKRICQRLPTMKITIIIKFTYWAEWKKYTQHIEITTKAQFSFNVNQNKRKKKSQSSWLFFPKVISSHGTACEFLWLLFLLFAPNKLSVNDLNAQAMCRLPIPLLLNTINFSHIQ